MIKEMPGPVGLRRATFHDNCTNPVKIAMIKLACLVDNRSESVCHFRLEPHLLR